MLGFLVCCYSAAPMLWLYSSTSMRQRHGAVHAHRAVKVLGVKGVHALQALQQLPALLQGRRWTCPNRRASVHIIIIWPRTSHRRRQVCMPHAVYHTWHAHGEHVLASAPGHSLVHHALQLAPPPQPAPLRVRALARPCAPWTSSAEKQNQSERQHLLDGNVCGPTTCFMSQSGGQERRHLPAGRCHGAACTSNMSGPVALESRESPSPLA